MDDFLVRALVAGLGVAIVAGPLGCFVVWRRMAYFGDTLAHSALLGISLGFLVGLDLNIGVAAVSLAVALLLAGRRQRRQLSDDTLLGILAHSTLALGLIVASFLERVRIDLMAYLFGDVLAVSPADLLWIWGGGGAALALLALVWRWLLAITVHEELAQVEGVPVRLARTAFMLLIALVVAVAMKIVGVVLVTSLLIIPAAAARRFAASPEMMAVAAAAIGAVAVGGGLGFSLAWDTPSGPSIVVAAAGLFLLASLARGGVVGNPFRRSP